MKALITGGAGFIGYHLAQKLLENGYEVVLADNFSRGVRDKYLEELNKNSAISLVSMDILDGSTVLKLGKDFDYIFHLAAIIGVQNVLNHSYDVLKNNVTLLLNLIELGHEQNHLKRFLFASTSEVYAGTLQYYGLELPTPENTPLTVSALNHPRTSYMLSKIYGEALLHQSKLPFTIFRPHNFYGPRMGMSHVIPELLRKAHFNENNGKLEVFSPTHQRTFCYIEDAVEIILRLAESEDALGETFNVGNEKPEYTMREVGEIILSVTDRAYQIKEMSDSPGSPIRRCPSMEKTARIADYCGKIGLQEGIKRTYQWYKVNVFDGNEVSAK